MRRPPRIVAVHPLWCSHRCWLSACWLAIGDTAVWHPAIRPIPPDTSFSSLALRPSRAREAGSVVEPAGISCQLVVRTPVQSIRKPSVGMTVSHLWFGSRSHWAPMPRFPGARWPSGNEAEPCAGSGSAVGGSGLLHLFEATSCAGCVVGFCRTRQGGLGCRLRRWEWLCRSS